LTFFYVVHFPRCLIRVVLYPLGGRSSCVLWHFFSLYFCVDFDALICIDSLLFESYHRKSLILCESTHYILNRFTPESSHFNLNHILKTLWLTLNRFILIWIISIFILGILNRFKFCLNLINHHCSSNLYSWCLNQFTHLVNRYTWLFLDENFHLHSFSIYNHSLITPKVLNLLHLFTLGLKNSLIIHSSRLNIFS